MSYDNLSSVSQNEDLSTDGRTDRQTDMVKPVYPLQLRCGGYNEEDLI
jgi:hypothetical protein